MTVSLWQLVGTAGTILGFVAGMVTGARKVVSPLLTMAAEWREFRGDWYGIPKRPGFPGHPGMAERVEVVESAVIEVRRELEFNGGGSLRDAVRRIEAQQVASATHAGAPVIALAGAVPIEQNGVAA